MAPETPIAQEIENVSDDIDQIAESVAVASILNEENQEEILEGIQQCRSQLESLSTIYQQQSTAENPMLAQVTAELARLAVQVESLKSSMDSMQSSLKQSALPPEPAEETIVVEAPPEPGAAVPGNPTPKRPRKFRLL